MNRYLSHVAAITLLTMFSGCLGHLRDRPLSYRDYGHSGAVHAHYLEPACDSCTTHLPAVTQACGSDSCASGHCDRCDGGTIQPLGAHHGLPLAQRIKQRLACGDGCGEVYIGEWISTPPTPDPCDFSGNYSGAGNDMIYREHAQPVRTTLRKLAGVRFLGTRYPTPWQGADAWYEDASVDEQLGEAWSPEFMGMPTPMTPTTTVGNSRSTITPHRAAASHTPACNCGH